LAAEAWGRLLKYYLAHVDRLGAIAVDMGLTPGHAKLLLHLDHPKPMRALAGSVHCDASTITWLVDRLEQLGLAERRIQPTDRRIKYVTLTATGEKTRADLMARLFEPPDDLLVLAHSELEALIDALDSLPD
jgi:DNA-binding MarR family transcriptional regulator